MTDQIPVEGEAAEEARARLFSEICFAHGWSQTLPPVAVVVLAELAAEGALTREQLHEGLKGSTTDALGLLAEALDPIEEWTDEELAAQRVEFADGSSATDESEPETAAEVMAEAIVDRQQRLAEMDRWSAELGVAPVTTIGELLDFMAACGVVSFDRAHYALNPSAPLPGEVLKLSKQ